MGVNPTPTNFKTFTFGGENSRSYGVYITGEGVFNAPERNVEMIEIPGRNGAFALDRGNFNNIEVTYPAGIFADTEADFAQAVSALRSLLCSKVGYVRLEDDYNPNEYRMAIYKSGLDVDHDLLIAGEFDLTFECKPQRYLKSGETAISVTSGDTITNPTRFDAQPMLEVTGFGDIDISGQAISVHDVYVGDVVLASAFSVNDNTAILPIDTSAGNVGDSLTVNEFKFEITQSYPEGIIGNPTCTASEGVASVKKTTTKAISFTLTVPKIEFAVQSYDNKTITFSFTVVTNNGTFVNHGTFNVYYDAYNGERIRFFISGGEFFGTTSKKTSILSIILNSTKSSLGQPMYIDLETGEAYNIISGEIVSVNNAVQIPAELPVLSSGANTITYGGTITQFDIVPRWWKV